MGDNLDRKFVVNLSLVIASAWAIQIDATPNTAQLIFLSAMASALRLARR